MMQVLPCAQVRDDLAAYHDGELEIEAQVLIQSHLQDCVACRLEAAALADLSIVRRFSVIILVPLDTGKCPLAINRTGLFAPLGTP